MSATDQPYHSSTAFSSIEEKLDVSVSSRSSCTIADVRDEILHLVVIVGGLCTFFLTDRFHRLKQEQQRKECAGQDYQLGRVFLQLFAVARVCGIDLRTSILKKIELNGRKYPVELCKVGTLYFLSTIERTKVSTYMDDTHCLINQSSL